MSRAPFFKRHTIADYLDGIAEGTLPDFYTEWDRPRMTEVRDYERLLRVATKEAQLQQFFFLHRHFLAEHLGGGHGRWVVPTKRLGSQYVTDFIIGCAHSFGFDWHAVELEAPRSKLFTRSGDPSATLNHAIRQIVDWRAWLQDNLDYARRPESEHGLGLTGIRPDLPGLILMGRRDGLTDAQNRLRAELSHQTNIEIHTFEYILDTVRWKAEAYEKRLQDKKP